MSPTTFEEPSIDPLLRTFAPLAGVVLALLSSGAGAQLADENLLFPLPSGYRIGYENRTARGLIVEMVKAGETVENWTELVTSQTFYDPPPPSPAVFRAATDRAGVQACPGYASRLFNDEAANGYPALGWISQCPNNPATSKPEWTMFRAIRGKDAMYVVQKAFKFEPDEDQVRPWTTFLRRVSACDTRGSEHPCPSTTPPSR